MSVDTKDHNRTVKVVQKRIGNFYKLNKRARIFHGSTNSTRHKLDNSEYIDISNLNNILEVNSNKRYVLAEANVSLEKLVDATLAKGFIPPVVSEFPTITIGGAIQGGAGESSSFKWGCFNEISLEYEIILGDGSKIITSPKKNADLFYGIPSSCGSLGIITSAKLSLIPATPTIKLIYQRVNSSEETIRLISKLSRIKKKPDFIDSIMFSKTKGVVMVGYFTKLTDLPKASFHRNSDEWFYLHAQKIMLNNKIYEELINTKDYLFRYDRGSFWAGRSGLKILHIPFNRFTRLLLARILKTKTLLSFLHNARLSQKFLIQDICLPENNTISFMKFVDEKYNIYPLWLCPIKTATKDFLSPNNLDTDLVINVGVWGGMSTDYDNFIRINRELETIVRKLNGRKVLYAHQYYTKQEFWQIYDIEKYSKLRLKYLAKIVFPNIYDKTKVSVKYKPSIARGFWKLLIE